MTETQTPSPARHDAPLQPGEVRHFEIGNRTYRVMHVAGGSFAQASVHAKDEPTRVIMTDRDIEAVVRAYAQAVEQAESDAIDQLDDADQPSFTAAGTYVPDVTDVDRNDHVIGSVRTLTSDGTVTLRPTRSTVLHTQTVGRVLRADPMDDFNLPLGASRTLVTGEAPGRSLAELVEDYGAAMAKAAMHLVMNGVAATTPHTDRAQELKAEILKHYDELPAGADEDALDSVDALRSKLMNLDGGRATWVLHHLATIERALRARFDA